VITSAVSAAVASPTVSANTAAPDKPDSFALQNTPPDAFISSENDPSSFAAGCQPDFVPRAKGRCPAGMLDPRPTFTHALEQQARMNRLVEIKDSVIKPLRGE